MAASQAKYSALLRVYHRQEAHILDLYRYIETVASTQRTGESSNIISIPEKSGPKEICSLSQSGQSIGAAAIGGVTAADWLTPFSFKDPGGQVVNYNSQAVPNSSSNATVTVSAAVARPSTEAFSEIQPVITYQRCLSEQPSSCSSQQTAEWVRATRYCRRSREDDIDEGLDDTANNV